MADNNVTLTVEIDEEPLEAFRESVEEIMGKVENDLEELERRLDRLDGTERELGYGSSNAEADE